MGRSSSSEEFGWAKSSTSRDPNPNNISSASAPGNCKEEEENEERLNLFGKKGANQDNNISGGIAGDISLREWLDRVERPVDLVVCLHIFRQIVQMVSAAHVQGVVVHNIRPSCFVMSGFNRVAFIESASCSSSGSGSDSCADGGSDGKGGCFESPEGEEASAGAFEEASVGSHLRSGEGQTARMSSVEEGSLGMEKDGEERKKSFPLKHLLVMEYNWYTSPEEAAGSSGSFTSDVYRLGVLLFELLCTFSSLEEKFKTMSNLRHRVLPPHLLLRCPKEASFCLWLLHPLPTTRPKLTDVLKSDFLTESRENLHEHEAAAKLREEIEDQELLLEFLLQLQKRKKESADVLHDTICCLSSDMEEVLKKQSVFKKKTGLFPDLDEAGSSTQEREDQVLYHPENINDLEVSGSRKRLRQGQCVHSEEETEEHSDEGSRHDEHMKNTESVLSKSSRLMKNFKKLEAAYLLTRCRMNKAAVKVQNKGLAASNVGRGSAMRTEGISVNSGGRKSEWMNPFLDGLCKYLSYSKFNVRADLKQGDLLNSSNLVCSLGFDRDKKLFATAGVNRKIKIFECDAIVNEDCDIHYPVAEMGGRSKLSNICWNNYIKSQIASSDFEGVVQVWDVTRNQVFSEMREHERRVWSVDFSLADPTKLASGSDDGTVKLWNTNQAILLLHLLWEASEPSKRRPMFARFNSHLTRVERLQLVQRIIESTCMIFAL